MHRFRTPLEIPTAHAQLAESSIDAVHQVLVQLDLETANSSVEQTMIQSRKNASPKMAPLAIVMLVAGGVLAGCSDDSGDDPADASPVVTADSIVPEATAEPSLEMSEPVSRPLPEGYPTDAAPTYPSARVTSAFKLGSGAMLKYMVTVQTNDSVDIVAASLADDYKSRGAEISATPLDEKGVGQIVASNDGYGIIMTYEAGEAPGTTTITYDVHKQRGRH